MKIVCFEIDKCPYLGISGSWKNFWGSVTKNLQKLLSPIALCGHKVSFFKFCQINLVKIH